MAGRALQRRALGDLHTAHERLKDGKLKGASVGPYSDNSHFIVSVSGKKRPVSPSRWNAPKYPVRGVSSSLFPSPPLDAP